MGQLIKFECQKIVQKRIVLVGLLLLVLFNFAMYDGHGPDSSHVRMPDNTYIYGRESIPLDKEISNRYAGPLTDEKVQQILGDFPIDPNSEYNNIYYPMNSIYETISRNFANEDGTWNGVTVQEMYPEVSNLEVGYNDGWSSLLGMMMYIMVAAGFLLIVAVSPIFSDEYARGTDALILTSRYGKKQCAKAKIIAASLFALLLSLLLIGINSLLFTTAFGMDGWHTSIQLGTSYLFDGVAYNLDFAHAYGYSLLVWFSGMLIITGVCLLFSAVCKSSFIALILTLFVYSVPMFINVSTPLSLKIMALNPIRGMLIGSSLALTPLNIGGNTFSFTWVIAIFMVVVVVLTWFFARRLFSKHQVVS